MTLATNVVNSDTDQNNTLHKNVNTVFSLQATNVNCRFAGSATALILDQEYYSNFNNLYRIIIRRGPDVGHGFCNYL